MSAYIEFSTSMRDPECLMKALEMMGFKKEHIEFHKEAASLRGVDNDIRPQKAHVIIRKKHVANAANDIGFEMKDGRFVAHISEYDEYCGSEAHTVIAKKTGGYGKKWQNITEKLCTNLEIVKRSYGLSSIRKHEITISGGKARIRMPVTIGQK